MADTRYLRVLILGAVAVAGLSGCTPGDEAEAESEAGAADAAEAAQMALGPVDGHDLPPADLERVVAGGPAPDFTALSSTGEPVTLSGYRGEKNVILFFYRGHW